LRALGGAYPDPSKKDPKLLVVDIEKVKPLAKPVTLAAVKADKKLANFDLVRNSRLSIAEGDRRAVGNHGSDGERLDSSDSCLGCVKIGRGAVWPFFHELFVILLRFRRVPNLPFP
jgi:hypothetical protein